MDVREGRRPQSDNEGKRRAEGRKAKRTDVRRYCLCSKEFVEITALVEQLRVIDQRFHDSP